MSTAKKAFIQRQHYLLSEEKRKELRQHATILQVRKRSTRRNDK